MNNGDALETSATNNTSYVDYDYDQNSKYNATHASNNEMREKLSFKEKVVRCDVRNSNPIHNNAYLDRAAKQWCSPVSRMNSCSQDESTSNMYINEMPRLYGAKNIARRNGGIF